MTHGLGTFLEAATSLEAQLALSYLVWVDDAPDPRLVDRWVRTLEAKGDDELPPSEASFRYPGLIDADERTRIPSLATEATPRRGGST